MLRLYSWLQNSVVYTYQYNYISMRRVRALTPYSSSSYRTFPCTDHSWSPIVRIWILQPMVFWPGCCHKIWISSIISSYSATYFASRFWKSRATAALYNFETMDILSRTSKLQIDLTWRWLFYQHFRGVINRQSQTVVLENHTSP